MARPIQRGYAFGSLALGVIEVVIGAVIIILSILASRYVQSSTLLNHFWYGIVFIVPGITGIAVGATRNFGVMIAFMVLNIILFVLQMLGVVLLGKAVSTIVLDKENCLILDCKIYGYAASIAIGTFVILIMSSISSLLASIIGCISVCSSPSPAQPGATILQEV